AVALVVDQARDQLLAGPALAGDEHGRRVARDLGGDLERARHGRRLGDDLTVASLDADFLAQPRDLAAQRFTLLRLAQRQYELVRTERLRQVVVRAGFHGVDRELDAAVRGHDDDEPHAALRLVPGQELEAAQARHAYVAEDDVGLQLGGAREAFLAVARGLRLIAFLGQDQGDRLAQAWFVVDDQ